MKRIAILGSDSTHTEVYAGLAGADGFRDQIVVHSIWGDDRLATEAKARSLAIPVVADTPEKAIEGADAVFVLSRFTADRARLGRLALAARVPVFIDKCISEAPVEARAFVEEAAAAGIPMMSCSPYRFVAPVGRAREIAAAGGVSFAVMLGPRECNDLGNDPRFRQLGFYGIHSVESVVEAFGPELEIIECATSSKGTAALLRTRSRAFCTIALLADLPGELYSLTLAGPASLENLKFSYDAELVYPASLRAILDQLFNGIERVAPESSVESVSLVAAMQAAA